MEDFIKKHYRRRMKRLKKGIREPFEKYKALQKLVKLVGLHSVVWHMAKQGRWHPWYTFIGCLVSLAVVSGIIGLNTYMPSPLLTWVFITPFLFLAAFVHYALWRATAHMRSGLGALLLRLYVIPMLTLLVLFMLGFIVVSLKNGLYFLVDMLAQEGQHLLPPTQ